MAFQSVLESDALETLLSQLTFPTPPTTSLHEMGEPNNQGVSMSFQQRRDLANVSSEFSLPKDKSVKFVHPQEVGGKNNYKISQVLRWWF